MKQKSLIKNPGNVWEKVFTFIQQITGNVDTSKGTLQKQIDTVAEKINGGPDSASGDIGFAEGIEADNVIDAINEVFQSGNEKKNKLVENLVAMGIEASTDETWESLLDKVLDMTDTSGDTVTAATLLSGYTAHNAAGEQITGAMADRRGTTVTAAAVTQDEEYSYLDLPEGQACYDGNSKVRALKSDLAAPINISKIQLDCYLGDKTPHSASSTFVIDVQKYTVLNIGSINLQYISGGRGTLNAYVYNNDSDAVITANEAGIFDISNVDSVRFAVSIGTSWADTGETAHVYFYDIVVS